MRFIIPPCLHYFNCIFTHDKPCYFSSAFLYIIIFICVGIYVFMFYIFYRLVKIVSEMETDGGTFNFGDYRENKNDTNNHVEHYLQNRILQG